MSEATTIAWTDSTWNPVRGCTKVSAGCRNCYAERFAERWRGIKGHPFEQGFDVRLVPEALELPLRWRKARRVFVNSMSDLFHEDVPFSFVGGVFYTMSRCPQHTFQILTKRPERMREFFGTATARIWADGTPLPNVWLGVSVENQREADLRIPGLLATPAAVRFLSCEPLLGPVDLAPTINAWAAKVARGGPIEPRLHWVIVGGESGPGARPADVSWIRSIVEQCAAARVPCFVKQLGAAPVMSVDAWNAHRERTGGTPLLRPPARTVREDQVHLALQDRKGADLAEWPNDLRVQQFPEVTP